MFSGIITEIGAVENIRPGKKAWTFEINASRILKRLKISHSIAVNGACLTVVKKTARNFTVEMIPETLRRTGFSSSRLGDRVNLEPAIRLSDEIGGHLVQGHVDGRGEVVKIIKNGRDLIFRIKVPKQLLRYIANKGFVAIDGVSLTCFNVRPNTFEVAIIPYTIKHTIFQYLAEGDPVNIETDMMAKYLERLLIK